MSQVFANLQVNGATASTVGGTGTARKVFPFLPGASIGVASTHDGIIWIPGSTAMNGQIVEVTIGGNFAVGSGGTCPSVTLDLLANTAAVGATPSYTQIATSGAITAQNLTGVYYPFMGIFRLIGDTLSGVVQGTQSWLTDNTSTPTTSGSGSRLTNLLSSRTFSTGAPAYGLAVGVTFSVSEPGNTANLYQFSASS